MWAGLQEKGYAAHDQRSSERTSAKSQESTEVSSSGMTLAETNQGKGVLVAAVLYPRHAQRAEGWFSVLSEMMVFSRSHSQKKWYRHFSEVMRI